MCVCAHVRARSVMFDSLQPHGLPGSSVCKSFKARILERVSVSYSRGSSSPRNQTCVSCVFCIGGQILYCYITWEVSPPPKKKKHEETIRINFKGLTDSQYTEYWSGGGRHGNENCSKLGCVLWQMEGLTFGRRTRRKKSEKASWKNWQMKRDEEEFTRRSGAETKQNLGGGKSPCHICGDPNASNDETVSHLGKWPGF